MNTLRSVVIIPVPESEVVVQDLRNKHDPASLEGVPAHITVLFPFYSPNDLTNDKIKKLKDIFKNTYPIEFSLPTVDNFPNVVYLKPKPTSPFIQLTKKVVKAFPDKLPYEGKFPSIKPHLTIAQISEEQNFEVIKKDIEDGVSKNLPIRAKVNEAWLMIENKNGNWTKKEVLPFRQL